MTCQHKHITTWQLDDGTPAGLWSCAYCQVKFEPIKMLKPLSASKVTELCEHFTMEPYQVRAIEQAHGIGGQP